MASLNPSSDISSFINTIFEASILVARDNNVMTSLVRTFNDRTGVATRQNSQYGGLTVNSIAETDDLVGQAFTPASIATLTPAEAGGQYFLTDTRVESDPFAVRNDASQDMGLAMGTKIETDLLGVFPSFTGGTIGTAGSTITWSYVYAMEAVLRAQKAPYPYFMVMHPYQWFSLKKAASVAGNRTNASDAMLDELRNSMYFVHKEGGLYFYVSSNFTIDANADAKPGMWSRDAIALDIRRQPRIEPERDASRRGWELNLSTIYGKGVWRPTFGVQGIFDCTAPTGV
jgi:hypothetical protein